MKITRSQLKEIVRESILELDEGVRKKVIRKGKVKKNYQFQFQT